MALNHGRTAADVLTRRRMLGRAGALAAAGGVATFARPGAAGATGTDSSLQRFLDFTVTQEQFGVTAVTERDPEGAGHAVRAVRTGAARGRHDGVHACRSARGDRRRAADLEVLDPGRRLRRRRRPVHEPRRGRGDRGQPLSRRRHRSSACAPTRSARACARRRWGRRPSTGCWPGSPPPSSARRRRRRTTWVSSRSPTRHQPGHAGPHGLGIGYGEPELSAGRLLRLSRRPARQWRRRAGREPDARVRPAIGRAPRARPAAPNAGTASDALHRCVPDGAPQMRTPDHSNA